MVLLNLTWILAGLMLVTPSRAWMTEKEPQFLIMKENDPHGVVGQELKLRCILQQKFLDKYPHCNASDITFTPNNDSHIEVISEREVVFTQNLTVTVNVMYRCEVSKELCENLTEHAADVTAGQSVKWGYAPVVPVFEPCIVNNWENMHCSWGPIQNVEKMILKTRTKATWQTVSRNGLCSLKDPLDHPHECSLSGDSLNVTEKYTITVTVWNVGGNKTKSITIDPLVKVKIKQLSMKVDKVMSRMAELTWLPPSTSNKDHVLADVIRNAKYRYKLIVEENGNSQENNFEKVTFNSVYYLQKLKPATLYKIKLSVKTMEGGYWSDPVSAEFTTSEDVPGADPVLFNGAFTRSRTENGVIVFWKGIPTESKHGRISYNVCINDLDKPRQEVRDIVGVVDQNYKELQEYVIKSDHQYKISVAACTAVGCTRPCVTQTGIVTHGLVIPKQGQVTEPEHVVAVSDEDANSITVHWSHTQKNTLYVVFWCVHGGTGICQDKLNSTGILKASEDLTQSTRISIESREFAVSSYIVGVSAVRDNIYSGIKWYTGCFYQANQTAANPSNVEWVSHGYHTLIVSWKAPDCYHDLTGFSEHFTVFYCPTIGDQCSGKTNTKMVQWYEKKVTLTDLESYNYKVWVTGHSGTLPPSSSVLAQVSGYWLDRKGALAGLIFGVLIVGSIAILGAVVVYRKMCKFKKKMTDADGICIYPPEIDTAASEPMMKQVQGTANFTYQRQESYDSGRDSGRGSLSYDRLSPIPRFCPNCQHESPLEAVPEEDRENSGSTVTNPNYILSPLSLGHNSAASSTISNTKKLNYVTVAPAEDEDDIVFSNNPQSSVYDEENTIKIQPKSVNVPEPRVSYSRSRGGSTSPLLGNTTSPESVRSFNFTPNPCTLNTNYVTENDVKRDALPKSMIPLFVNLPEIDKNSSSRQKPPTGYVTEDDIKNQGMKDVECNANIPIQSQICNPESEKGTGKNIPTQKYADGNSKIKNQPPLGYVDHADLAKLNNETEEELTKGSVEDRNNDPDVIKGKTNQSNQNKTKLFIQNPEYVTESSLTEKDTQRKCSAPCLPSFGDIPPRIELNLSCGDDTDINGSRVTDNNDYIRRNDNNCIPISSDKPYVQADHLLDKNSESRRDDSYLDPRVASAGSGEGAQPSRRQSAGGSDSEDSGISAPYNPSTGPGKCPSGYVSEDKLHSLIS